MVALMRKTQPAGSTFRGSVVLVFAAMSSAFLIAGCAGTGEGASGTTSPISQPPTSPPPTTPPPTTPPPPPPTSPTTPPSNPTASVEALDADWIARSTGNGVIFAHDFREPDEVRAFMRNATRAEDASGRDLYAVPAFGNSKALLHQIMGTTLAEEAPVSTPGAVEVWTIADGSKWPVAVRSNPLTHYTASVRKHERVLITEGPWQDNGWKIRVTRRWDGGGNAVQHAAGSAIATWNTEWERVLTALPAGQNGKSANDPGYGIAGNAGPGNWNRSGANAHFNFRGGYWAHADTIAEYGPGGAWASDKGTIPNAFNGSEFYIQYRVRFGASKWAGASPVARSGKSFYLQTASGSSAQQMYVPIGGSPSTTYSGDNGATSPFTVVMDGQNPGSHLEVAPWDGRDLSSPSLAGRQIQPGSAFTQCLYGTSGSHCWMWPADKWVTVLLHIKPSGVNFYRRTAKLKAPLTSVDYYKSDGVTRNYPTQNIAVEAGSLATWPDPAEYPYYIQVSTAGGSVTPAQSGTQYEAMRVTAINYGTDTLTVVRNIYRTNRTVNVTHPATSSFLYGMSNGGKSYGWLDDPRLAPHKDGLIDIRVAVEGAREYTQVFYMEDVPMMYGDNSSTYGDFSSNAPGFNSFRASHYANLVHSLEGAVSTYSTAEYTQIILSKNPIPCPQAWD